MPEQSDVKLIEDGKEKKGPRITAADFKHISEFVCTEFERRKKNRLDLEKEWKDIDRQIAMEPDTSFKKVNGVVDKDKAWMSELELPLQAQTVEVLTSDARRMMFGKPWFTAHAEMTDKYLEKVDFQSMVSGDENEVPSMVNQDNVDKIVTAILQHYHRQYDFRGNIDHINAEAFKYGVGVGCARLVTKPVFIQTSSGIVREDQKIPMLVPRSIKNTYKDDRAHLMNNEGAMMGESVISTRTQGYADLVMAANRGSNDPNSDTGGWIPKNLKGIEQKDDKTVDIIEYEGDIVVPRKSRGDIFIPGAIITVVKGGSKGKNTHNVVRFRFRKKPFSSFLFFPYHVEDLDNAYATSPCRKGRQVQIAATSALNRVMDAAALQNAPPVGYDQNDPFFSQGGGPVLAPYAQMPSVGDIKVYDFASTTEMLQVYVGFLQQYADVTGISAPRLGAQTTSHTTAFAKEAELSRGTVRTVDYVQSAGFGPLSRWLHMEYEMAKDVFTSKRQSVYMDSDRMFISVNRDFLPENVSFEWLGAGGPAEEAQESQKRQQAIISAMTIDAQGLQLEAQSAQAGMAPILDREKLVNAALIEGGIIDTDALKRSEILSGAGETDGGLSGPLTGLGGSGAATALVQNVGDP